MVIANPRAELNPVLPVGRQISNVIYYHLGVRRAEADRRRSNAARRAHPTLSAGSAPSDELSGAWRSAS
jgi:ABC-type microcin C transport system duplicated ATPase subunit YejF